MKFIIFYFFINKKMSNIMNDAIQSNEQSCSQSLMSQGQKNNFLQTKFAQIIDYYPKLTPDQAFYFEYCKLYISTLQLQEQVTKTQLEVDQLRQLFTSSFPKHKKLTMPHSHHSNSNQEKKKRIRRTANEIARHYICKVDKCQKSYGSEGSLNQHIKLKHKQLFESGQFRNILP